MDWNNGSTLGPREKTFKWKYSKSEGLVIIRLFKNGNYKTKFTNKDLERIIDYIKIKKKVYLANNVEKLVSGTEREGIGSFIYNNISKNTADAQAASQLASILYKAGVLGFNGASRGMEFWVLGESWKEKLIK